MRGERRRAFRTEGRGRVAKSAHFSSIKEGLRPTLCRMGGVLLLSLCLILLGALVDELRAMDVTLILPSC